MAATTYSRRTLSIFLDYFWVVFFFLHSYSPQFSGSLRFHSPNLGTVDNDKLHQEKVNIDFIFIPYRLALGPLNYLVFVRRPDGGAHSIFHSG